MSQPQLVATDLVVGESARWHERPPLVVELGRPEILAYDLEGHREVLTRVPTTIPFSIDQGISKL